MDEDSGTTFGSQADTLQDLGVGAIRVPFFWYFDQDRLTDAQRAEIAQILADTPSGFRVVFVPLNAVETPTDEAARERYCSFAADVVATFPRIRDVIIWNEPNLSAFWRPQFDAAGQSAAPAAYMALLARCYDLLHAARADVNVIGPATSPAGNDNPNAVSNISHSPAQFIRKMGEAYRASGRTRRLFDTVAQHVYGVTPGERPWVRHTGSRISQGDQQRLMNQLRNGFAETAQPLPGGCGPRPAGCVWIWFTEAGYQTIPDSTKASFYTATETVAAIPDYAGGEPDEPAPSATSTAPDQWTQFYDAIRLARCQPYVQAFFNYLLIDHSRLNEWQSGLLWADGTRKRSYDAFKAAAAEAKADRTDCNALKGGPVTQFDTTPPAAPAPLDARPHDGEVQLDWPDAPGAQGSGFHDVLGYHVYRSATVDGPYARVTTGLLSPSAWVDRDVVNGRRYWYAVTAVDTSEQEGERSAAACAIPRRAGETYGPCDDLTPPEPPVLRATVPASPANQNVPNVRGSAEAGSTVRLYTSADCTGAVAATGSAAVLADPGLAVAVANDTTTVFRATATDASGNTSACSAGLSYVEDSTAPDTTIVSGPGAKTAETRPTFSFVSTEAGTFQCRVDRNAFLACSSPHTTAPLASGKHTFEVRALDAAGNVDASVAARTFTVLRTKG